MVIPSAIINARFGWRSAANSISWGASHRAVVPIIPTLTVPVTSSLQAATSETSASSSERMRRARANTASPSWVK